jgi:hypothetical protein
MEALKSLGYVLSGVGASVLASHGYNLLLALSIGAMGVAGTALWTLPLAPKTADTQDNSYLSYLREGTKLVLKNIKILYIVLFMSIVFGFGVIDEFFSLFFREKGIANAQVGLWIGFIFGMAGLGNLLAHKLDGKRIPTVLSLVGWAVVFSLASISPAWLAPLFIGLYMFYFSGLVVLMYTYLQREISDKLRATTVSIAGVCIEAISLAVYALFSWGARHGYGHALRVSSIVLLGCAVALLIGFRSSWLVTNKPAKTAAD